MFCFELASGCSHFCDFPVSRVEWIHFLSRTYYCMCQAMSGENNSWGLSEGSEPSKIYLHLLWIGLEPAYHSVWVLIKIFFKWEKHVCWTEVRRQLGANPLHSHHMTVWPHDHFFSPWSWASSSKTEGVSAFRLGGLFGSLWFQNAVSRASWLLEDLYIKILQNTALDYEDSAASKQKWNYSHILDFLIWSFCFKLFNLVSNYYVLSRVLNYLEGMIPGSELSK